MVCIIQNLFFLDESNTGTAKNNCRFTNDDLKTTNDKLETTIACQQKGIEKIKELLGMQVSILILNKCI